MLCPTPTFSPIFVHDPGICDLRLGLWARRLEFAIDVDHWLATPSIPPSSANGPAPCWARRLFTRLRRSWAAAGTVRMAWVVVDAASARDVTAKRPSAETMTRRVTA